MWRAVFLCCILSLLGATGFPLLNPQAGASHSRKGRSPENWRPFHHPYVQQLYEKITYKNGTIIKGNIGDDPITIWSFLDTDLVREIRHPEYVDFDDPEGRQTIMHVFDWTSLQNDSFDSHYNLSKVILRLYKDGNFSKGCARATLQAKVYCRHAYGESEFTGNPRIINLANGRHWEELDLTDQFKSLWPIPYMGSQVYVTVTLNSKCVNNKLPIKLYNLKSISKLKMRRKLYENQPVLCLYLKDEMIEKLARNGDGHAHSIPNDEVLSVPENGLRRARRDGSSNYCRKIDHTVSFRKLDIPHVILPVEYNAGRCVGYCDFNFIDNANKYNEVYRVNNYAKLVAAQAHVDNDPEVAVCCSPGEYDPLMLLISTADGSSVKQKLYHEMRIRDCYCR